MKEQQVLKLGENWEVRNKLKLPFGQEGLGVGLRDFGNASQENDPLDRIKTDGVGCAVVTARHHSSKNQ